MAHVNLSLLGGFQARPESGQPLTFQTKKAQALLAYLALPLGQAHPRDKLAALLWGEMRDEQARASLRQALFDLRKALGATMPSALRTEGGTVALDPTVVHLDVAAFTRLVGEGTPDALAQAVTLYRGDLLAGLSVNEEPFETWLMEERERLHELALEALAKLLSHQSKAGVLEAAIRTALRLLALDPLQEVVHRGLMRFYAQAGRRGAALRQYQRCVTVLQRELGLEPEAETRQLYQEILQQRASRTTTTATMLGLTTDATPPIIPLAAADARPAETPLVGREPEMARLRNALDQVSAGRGQLVALVGEAGIGKSRLIEELIAYAVQQDSRVFLGRAYESDQILPFGPWVDAFRTGQLAQDRDVIEALGPVWRAELSRLLPEVAVPGARPPTDRADDRRLFETVAQLVKQLATRNVLLLMLEDLHWADEMSLRLLAFLGRRIQTARVLVIATAREEEMEDGPMLRLTLEDLAREGRLVLLPLRPLSQPDTIALVRMLAGTGSKAATVERLGEQVWIASEGNPFMVVETMRALGEGAAPEAPSKLPLPQRVREVTSRRLERVSDRSRSLLAVASVIGREFEFQLLQGASGLDEDSTADGVEELIRRRVLTAVGERLDFTHDRIREVVCAQLPPWRRKRLHHRIAEAMEALYADNLEPHYEALGIYYQESEVWEKATVYLHQAGNKAASRSAHQQAVAYFDRALAALAHLPESRRTLEEAIAIHIDLGPALMATKSFSAPEVGETYTRARELCQRLGETPHLFPALWGLARFYSVRGDLQTARSLGEQLITLAERVRDPALLLEAHHTQMAVLFNLGEFSTALNHSERGIALYDPQQHGRHRFLYGNHDPGVCCMTHAAWALWLLGYPDQALQRTQDALTLARELSHPYTLAHALFFGAWVHQHRGDGQAVQARTEEGLALSTGHDWPRWLALGAALQGRVLVEQGKIEEGIALMRQGVVDALEGQEHMYCGALLAEACGRPGKTEEGLGVVNEELARAHQTGCCCYEAELHRIKGELLLKPPFLAEDEAESCFHQSIQVARGQMAKSLELRAAMSLTRVWQRQGKAVGARALLADVYGRFTEGFDTVDLKEATILLAHPRVRPLANRTR